MSLKIWEMHCLNIFLHFCAFFFIWTVSISLHISMHTAQKSESGPEHHWAPEHLQVQPGMIGSKDGLNNNVPLVFDWLWVRRAWGEVRGINSFILQELPHTLATWGWDCHAPRVTQHPLCQRRVWHWVQWFHLDIYLASRGLWVPLWTVYRNLLCALETLLGDRANLLAVESFDVASWKSGLPVAQVVCIP